MVNHNELGSIAETYNELQGIPLLWMARSAHSLPPASPASFIRTVLQAAEILLHNLADLTRRAADDLPASVEGAMHKVAWANGFHHMLLRLSRLPTALVGTRSANAPTGLRVTDSPAFRDYRTALCQLDAAVLKMSESGLMPIGEILADHGMDDSRYRLLHLLRISAQHARNWEHNLALVPIDTNGVPYETFVATAPLRSAVFDLSLRGDTFFTQFRGLHQIPEVLGAEANDLLEAAVVQLRDGERTVVLERLQLAGLLLDEIAASVQPLVENLSVLDYHSIRANFGKTSGSHSAVLRHELFGNLYRQLVEAALEMVACGEDVEQAVRLAESNRHNSAEQWITYAILMECYRIGTAIDRWRELHLHLPRNTLGSGSRSLAGAPDAVRTVEMMRVIAHRSDPLRPLLESREVPASGRTPLAEWFDGDASLDSRLAEALGRLTQERFADVQQRTGGFAAACPFTAPSRRVTGNLRPLSPDKPSTLTEPGR